jgi:hypothetical protein
LKTHCHINAGLEQQLIDALRQRAMAGWADELIYAVPMFVDLLYESHDRPMYDLELAVRAMLREHTRVTADPIMFDRHAMEHHVRLLVELLDHLRRQQMDAGQWSNTAAAPQMFG